MTSDIVDALGVRSALDNGAMTRRVTIEDIATAAGVSRQTVTRAMNGMPRISEETRARVLETSDRLGYRPSRFASNLARSTKITTVAFVVDSFRNPYYSELAADLLDVTSSRGWQMTIASHENEPELELVARLAREVDAVVGYFNADDEAALVTAARGVPVVLLGTTASAPSLHSVDIDFQHGLRELIPELMERGSKRFGLLESHRIGTRYESSSRRQAYESAVDADSTRRIVVCDADAQSVDAGQAGLHTLLDSHPETDTVIGFSDLIAMGALRAAHDRGLAVPKKLKIVGIDGLSLGAVTSPSLTSLGIIGSDFTDQIADVIHTAITDSAAPAARRYALPSMRWRESA